MNVSRVPMGPLVRELKLFLVAHGFVLILLTFYTPHKHLFTPRAGL